MPSTTSRRAQSPASTTRERDNRQEPLPTWRNTRPRGNPEPDRKDLERSRERFESLLGR
jgi:hypothetical protein